jgi:hypothetical protein
VTSNWRKGIKGRKQIAAPLAPLDPLAHQSGGAGDHRKLIPLGEVMIEMIQWHNGAPT